MSSSSSDRWSALRSITALIVDDEQLVREAASEALAAMGAAVITAGDGEEALAVAAAHDGQLQLLITDVVMPRMGGATLAARLSEQYPELEVLFISGYAPDASTELGPLSEQRHLLQKPFTPTSLLTKLREILEPHPS